MWQAHATFCKKCFDLKALNRKNSIIFKEKAKDTWRPLEPSSRSMSIEDYLVSILPAIDQPVGKELEIVGFDVGSTIC